MERAILERKTLEKIKPEDENSE